MAGGSYVGLDIGSNLIKVAEMRRGSGGIEVVSMDMAPTPQAAFENNIIVDAQLLGKAVKDLLKKAGIGTNQSVSSVSGQSAVVVRVIDVPQMEPKELAETMKWEVERQVPFAVNEVIMDYQAIERPEGYAPGQNMEVLLAVAQQDMIDRHVEMLFAAGLKPKAIDVEPLAVGRAILDLAPTQPSGHTVAIVNIGASNTDIGIFRDKLLAFPRTLPLAGDNFTRAISDALQVDMATAENYKRELGEVMFNQQTSQQSPDFTSFGAGGGGGFVDFSTPQATTPAAAPEFSTGPTSSPSGRMPFDFSSPGEAPPPPAPTPFDFSSSPDGETPAPAPLDSGFDISAQQPGLVQPAPDNSGFYAPQTDPGFAPPQNNLPAPVPTGGDPNRDALKIQVFNAIAPVLAEIVQEIRRSLDYYRTKTGDAPVHEILLIGGTSKLRNLGEFLTSELGIPTRVANPLQTLRVSAKNYSQSHLDEIASLFPVSIGLGARELIDVPVKAKAKK